jgi:tripartite-type tricarboxylate transporter receptor subunit TctC
MAASDDRKDFAEAAGAPGSFAAGGLTRRTMLGAMAAGLSVGSGFPAFAEDKWPSRVVKLVCTYAAGGSSDISLRIVAEQLEHRLNAKFIVENKPGASTRIANESVARSAPDGYTFLYAAAPYATVGSLFGKLSYDPHKDLKPVAMAMFAPLFLIVNAEAPYKTLKEFIAYGKSQPNGLTFGSPAAGSQPHLAIELFLRSAGVKGVAAQFRGDAPSYTELLAGRIDATLTAISTALPYVETGKLRVLGAASAERSAVYPNAPTLREQGYPDVVATGWYGFLAPAGTPQPVIVRLNAAVNAQLQAPDTRAALAKLGLDPKALSPQQFGAVLADELRLWAAVAQQTGIKLSE